MLKLADDDEIENRILWLDSIDPTKRIFRGKSYEFIKRIFDVSAILISLPLCTPIFIILMICIKLSAPSAPIFFVEKRIGKNGKLFNFYKFRTMVPKADSLKEQYSHLNELVWPDFKIEVDPRVTKIGNFLRKTSLDELPQLLNVLIGNMSLVGPRPTSVSVDNFTLWQTERCRVIPGITGLWQIIGRNEVGFVTRIRLDITYIKKRCLWLDFQILFRTISVVFRLTGR
ncbi:MAG: sugar transferase [Desulfotalea sp.]